MLNWIVQTKVGGASFLVEFPSISAWGRKKKRVNSK